MITMEKVLFLCALMLPVWVGAQDCTLTQYQKLLTEADQATVKGQYDLAINKLQSAKICRPEREEEVSRKILIVFEKVNGERQAAIRNAEEARQQEEKARQNEAEAKRQEEIAQKNAAEALENAAEAQRQSSIAQAEKEKAEAETRRVYSNSLSFKSKTVLSEGDRNTAFRLALFAHDYVDPQNPAILQALADALYYNGNIKNEPKAWCEQTLQGHSDYVLSVAFSPDGKKLATGSLDNTIKIWDLKTGGVIQTLTGHTEYVKQVIFSPDGKQIASCSFDYTAKVWSWESGQVFQNFKHNNPVSSVAFSPDGTKLATSRGAAYIWDINTGRLLRTIVSKKTLLSEVYGVSCVAFSPDGTMLVTGNTIGNDRYALKIWDVNTGKFLFAWKAHKDKVTSVAFSPDGTKVASGSHDTTAKVWDLKTRKNIFTLEGHQGFVKEVCFSPDGQRLVTGSDDYTAKVWDMKTGKVVLALSNHLYRVIVQTGRTDGFAINYNCVAFSPDGTKLATGAYDNAAKVWDLNIEKGIRILKGHSGSINEVSFSPDGSILATASEDKTVKTWDLNTGKEILTLQGHSKSVTSLDFSSDGMSLATGSVDKTAKIWDLGKAGNSRTLTGHTDEVTCIAFSPDGKRIASGAYGMIKIYDLNGNDTITLNWRGQSITDIAFSPDGTRLAISSRNGVVKIFDLGSQKELLTIRDSTHSVQRLAFHPDGKKIATTGNSYYSTQISTVKIWNVDTGKEIRTINNYPRSYHCVSFSPDGRWIVAGSSEIVRIWDMAGKEVLTITTGYASSVKSIVFSPDGKRLAAGSVDTTARIWELYPEDLIAAVAKNYRLAEFISPQLEAYDLDVLLDIHPQNESILLATRETWQIAAFADLYTKKIAETGFPEKSDYERALRLYEACLSHHVDDAYFRQKIEDLKITWAKAGE